MVRGFERSILRRFVTGLVLVTGAGACGSAELPLEGTSGSGHRGGSQATAGAASAGGGRAETGGGNGAGAGSAESTPDVIPPPVSPTGLKMFQIRGEPYGSVNVVSFVGDLDHDGFDELAVAEITQPGPAGATERETEGAIYVFYGRPAFPSMMNVLDADFVLYGVLSDIERLGDLDGDGYDDMLFVALCHHTPSWTCPTDGVYVVYGGPERLTGEYRSDEVGIRWISDHEGARYSGAVNAGDVNGDGHPDLLIDMLYLEPAGDRTCETFLVLGRSDRALQFPALGYADAVFAGSSGEYRTFYGSLPAGDVDGDGFADVLLRASNETRGHAATDGLTNLFYGGPDKLTGTLTPGDADASLGVLVREWPQRGLGDLDGDGYGDFALYTSSDDERGEPLDQVRIVYGGPTRFSGSYGVDFGGFSASMAAVGAVAGDMNGDGKLDLAMISSADATIALLAGTGERWHGALSITPEYLAVRGPLTTPDGKYSAFGSDSALDGDVNGDGFADLAVTASSESSGDLEPGSAYVYLGAPF